MIGFGAVAAQPAVAEPVAASAEVSASTVVDASAGASASAAVDAAADVNAAGANVLDNVQIQVRSNPDSDGSRPHQSVRMTVNPDGSVKIILGEYCLDTWALDGFVPIRTYAFPSGCGDGIPSQDYWVIPEWRTPSAAPNANREDAEAHQFFYLESKTGKQCLSSNSGGLFPDSGNLLFNYAHQMPCDPTDNRQQFRVSNEFWSGDVGLRWQALLQAATTSALKDCQRDTSLEDSPCLIQFANDPSHEWLVPGVGRALTLGTIIQQPLGCGSPYDGSSVRRTNNNTRDETVTVGSETTSTHTLQWSIGGAITIEKETSKVLDLVTGKLTGTFSVNGGVVDTTTTSTTAQNSVTQSIAPGMTLMNTWTGNMLSFTGRWKVGLDNPSIAIDKGMAWMIDATSTLPINKTLTNTAYASFTEKSCFATAPSSNTAAPKLVVGSQTCEAATDAPVASVGDRITVCPGTWTLGAGSPNPYYRYQWYIVPAGSTTRSPLPNATGNSLVVSSYMRGATIGASVIEEGSLERFASDPVDAPNTAAVSSAPAHSAVLSTTFAGDPAQATVGQPYSANLVFAPGSGMHLTTSSADLHGLSISSDGVVTGTPTSPGDVSVTVTDTPTDGGDPVSSKFTITILPLARTVSSAGDGSLAATVGQAVSIDLVDNDSADSPATLSGEALPAGVTFDPITGELSGTPTQAGESTFTISTSSTQRQFSLVVSDIASTLSDQPLPTGSVGVPYSAQTVTALGTSPFIVRAPAAQPGENAVAFDTSAGAPAGQPRMPTMFGLTLDPLTGELSGTPTSAGTVVIAVADLSSPDTPPQVKTITIAAVAPAAVGSTAASTPAKATALAATGADSGVAVLWAIIAVLVLLGGVALIALRRRSARN